MIPDAGQWWPAPAKLNLFLHVTGQRPDGYHTLQTLFQILDWGDEVFIRPNDCGEISRLSSDYDVPQDEDLAIRAALALKQVSGCEHGADIQVRKHIPPGGGLGGGSSDAATVLVVLNQLWECGLSVETLAELGLELGADVPVFIHGNSAMATGVGEELVPLSLGERHYLLVFPPFPINTARVFADESLRRDSELISVSDALAGAGRNDCEAVARQLYPALSELFEELAEYGQPRLSGTGSTVFLELRGGAKTSSATSQLKCRYNVRAVGGLDQSPLQNRLFQRT